MNTFRATSSLAPPTGYLEFRSCSMFLLCVIRKRKCWQTAPLPRKAASVLTGGRDLGRVDPAALDGFEPSVPMMLLFRRETAAFVLRGLARATCLISLYDSCHLYKTECISTITCYFVVSVCFFCNFAFVYIYFMFIWAPPDDTNADTRNRPSASHDSRQHLSLNRGRYTGFPNGREVGGSNPAPRLPLCLWARHLLL